MNTITLFGCGAVGSQVAYHLATPEIRFILVDDDRVSEDNLGTSAFMTAQVGVPKSLALANLLWRKAQCISTDVVERVDVHNVMRFVRDSGLLIDCFDNAEARIATLSVVMDSVHVGVSRSHTGSIFWDDTPRLWDIYQGPPRGEDTFCTHLAGRKILRLTASIAAHIIDNWMQTGRKESLTVTEGLKIYG